MMAERVNLLLAPNYIEAAQIGHIFRIECVSEATRNGNIPNIMHLFTNRYSYNAHFGAFMPDIREGSPY
jgi:hypothetical protein